MTRTSSFVLAVALLIGLVPSLLGQAHSGTLKGEVEDPQSATVAGAQLTLTNEATGVTAKTTSGAAGEFSFVDLAPGVYTLKTGATGFSVSTQQHVTVDVGKTLALVVTLQPGSVQQTVTVTANAAAVESQTSDIGTSITPEEIKDLPVSLSGDMRNPLSFMLLTLGVSGSTPGPTPDYRLHISGSNS